MGILLGDYSIAVDCGCSMTFVIFFQNYLVAAMEECQLQTDQGQLLKCIQLYNTVLVRHGVVVLGPTGGGKSTVLRLLRKALNNAHEDHYGPKRKVLGNLSLRASLSLAGSISEVCGQADYPCSCYNYEQVFLQYEDNHTCCDHCNALSLSTAA